MPAKILAKNIKHFRKVKRWSQLQMANILGIHFKTLCYLEKEGTVRTDTIIRLSQLFGCTIDDLCRKNIGGK